MCSIYVYVICHREIYAYINQKTESLSSKSMQIIFISYHQCKNQSFWLILKFNYKQNFFPLNSELKQQDFFLFCTAQAQKKTFFSS